MNRFRKRWESLPETRRAGYRFAGVTMVLLTTLLVTVSVISYLFTWQPDQSALAAGGGVENAEAAWRMPPPLRAFPSAISW